MRIDLSVYNEAGSLSLIAAGAVADLLAGDGEDTEAIAATGRVVLLQLVQDDAYGARVVLGEALLPEEEERWLMRQTARLEIPDERGLLVCGGFDLDSLHDLQEEGQSDYVEPVAVPPGEYRVDLYTYGTSVNAMFLDEAAWEAQQEALLPDDEDEDEEEEEEEPTFLDFLFHLQPWDDAECTPTEEGFLGTDSGKRDPFPTPWPQPVRLTPRPRPDDD